MWHVIESVLFMGATLSIPFLPFLFVRVVEVLGNGNQG